MCQFSGNGQLWLFGPKFAQKWILGSEYQKTHVGIKTSILEIPCVPIFRQNRQLVFLGPNLPKTRSWGQNFKNLSLDSKSAPPRYHVSQFSVKMDNFEFFDQNLGKLPNYVRYFGTNIVEVLQRAGWRLKWAGWRWMELVGGG